MQRTRRAFLQGSAALVGAAGLAGCADDLGSAAGGDGGREGYAAFFTLYDFARNVGGDAFETNNPVPAGRAGHGWEPDASLRTDVVSSDAFVYLDVEGFQRWAVDAAASAERDNPDITLVDAVEGIDLREYEEDGHGDDGSHDEEGGHDHDGSHDEEDGHDHDGSHDEEDDHDHDDRGGLDPHYWTDPVLARESVDNVVAGLSEADPDNAETYEENGESYGEDLRALHERFQSELADRERDAVVIAAHDSYQYLAARYDFDIHSPQGVSPHAEPTQDEIAETIELIDREGIDVVLYDTFESQNLADALVRESGASRTVELSPAEGTTEEWDEKGWGYLEQMEEINLPALKEALGSR